MAAQKPEVCKPSVVIRDSHHISSSSARNSNGYTHIFDVALFNDIAANKPEVAIYRK